MDPNANLAEQRRLVVAILADDSASDLPEKAQRLAELAQALDEWLSNGGFLPYSWVR